MERRKRMKKYWRFDIAEVLKDLNTDSNKGLSSREVEIRLSKYGTNSLKGKGRKSIFSMFIEQFNNYMVIILIIAAFISFFLERL